MQCAHGNDREQILNKTTNYSLISFVLLIEKRMENVWNEREANNSVMEKSLR